MAFTRWTKTWIVAVLVSLMLYDVRWLYGVVVSVYQISIGARVASWWRFWLDYALTGLVGDMVRLFGVCLALYAIYLTWAAKRESFLKVKKYVSVAVLCEGIYFLILAPITVIEFTRGVVPLLMAGYLLQILFASSMLIVLSVKVWRYSESTRDDVVKWAAIAGISYLAGIWVNNVFRTFLSGVTSVVFLNAIITLSLSLVFAIAGFHTLLKTGNRRRTTKLFAVSLILLGLHFAVFILSSWITNTLVYALLVEIWPATFLGLGFSLLKENKHNWFN